MFTSTKMSLCNSHNTIMYWVREIKKDLKKLEKSQNIENQFDTIYETLNKISVEARVAKKKGQRMENRLSKYRRSIELLGFKRIG